MNRKDLKNAIDILSHRIEQKNLELYQKIISEGIEIPSAIESPDDFSLAVLHPWNKFISALITTQIGDNEDVKFILKNFQFLEQNFEFYIEKIEGLACSVDKSRMILRAIYNFYKTGKKIEFNYDQEYTFHLPKVVFTNHESIIEFYQGLKGLRYGNNIQYLETVKNIETLTPQSK
ncbi:hypothetical protein V6R21_06370 [Limibacter armeniacum]|uniref:hypothetical protein n=1 Tax=Limibacter armeniacum TaxID=466084 RepID=UPI002FE4FF5A